MELTRKNKKQKSTANENFKKLKLLVTVVNRNKTEFFMDFLTAYEVNFQTSVLAQQNRKRCTCSVWKIRTRASFSA